MKCLPCTASDLAKYIINKSIEIGNPISNVQLQFYLYTIQVEHIRKYNTCAFFDKIEVWDFGPVVSKVYSKYKHWGAFPIPGYPQTFGISHPSLEEVVNEVCLRYDGKIAFDLVQIAHAENTPYSIAKKTGRQTISCRLINSVVRGEHICEEQ